MSHVTAGPGVHAKLDELAEALTTSNLRTAVNHIRRHMKPTANLDATSTEWTAWTALAQEYRSRCAARAAKLSDAELAERIASRMKAGAIPADEATAIAHAADEDEFCRRNPAAAAIADAWPANPDAADIDPWGWHHRLLAAGSVTNTARATRKTATTNDTPGAGAGRQVGPVRQ